ncbi:PD-(D/E)XK nuclease superfamily protein [Arenibacter algicola]|uniref:PD-(D/E)XK nuclease superfamily protein n=1 Tax=Arenibacter algicola TaxID=616991 RepID=A0ABY3AE82_9FLAO
MQTLERTIEKVARSLPDMPPPLKKNLFDIMGVQNKETINSKVLAYFLDPNESHGLGTLFFDSLKKLLIEKKEDVLEFSEYSGEFQVSTEDTTYYAEGEDQQLKRIDITIQGEDWCIIIENKLYHTVDNPLKAYWQHAKKNSEHVVGIVLSLKRLKEDECTEDGVIFTNITHKSWLDNIQKNLIIADIDNDTDIIYLREYIKTINTHYQYMKNEPSNNAIVNSFINQKEAIEKIEKNKAEAIKHIDRQIEEVFEAHGYVKDKQWYCHPKNHNLCFFVLSSSEILKTNSMRFAFEVFNDLKKELGDGIKKIHKAIETLDLGADFYFDDKYNKSNMSRIITYRNYDFLHEGTNVKAELEKILNAHFFNTGGIVETTIGLFPMTLAKEFVNKSVE